MRTTSLRITTNKSQPRLTKYSDQLFLFMPHTHDIYILFLISFTELSFTFHKLHCFFKGEFQWALTNVFSCVAATKINVWNMIITTETYTV